LLALIHISHEKKVENDLCEEIYEHGVSVSYVFQTCKPKYDTPIDYSRLMVSKSDLEIQGLHFHSGKHFLPEGVAEKFPHLKGYDAAGCSINKLSMTNFKGLIRLQVLMLEGNRFESIMSGTFEDLIVLEYLNLCK
jgi:Leucine rich repeat